MAQSNSNDAAELRAKVDRLGTDLASSAEEHAATLCRMKKEHELEAQEAAAAAAQLRAEVGRLQEELANSSVLEKEGHNQVAVLEWKVSQLEATVSTQQQKAASQNEAAVLREELAQLKAALSSAAKQHAVLLQDVKEQHELALQAAATETMQLRTEVGRLEVEVQRLEQQLAMSSQQNETLQSSADMVARLEETLLIRQEQHAAELGRAVAEAEMLRHEARHVEQARISLIDDHAAALQVRMAQLYALACTRVHYMDAGGAGEVRAREDADAIRSAAVAVRSGTARGTAVYQSTAA